MAQFPVAVSRPPSNLFLDRIGAEASNSSVYRTRAIMEKEYKGQLGFSYDILLPHNGSEHYEMKEEHISSKISFRWLYGLSNW